MDRNVPRRYSTYLRDSSRWDGFALRTDDIVITAPTKCGTTWLQMICALLVLQTPTLPDELSRLSPWLDMTARPVDEVYAELERQQHRRFIKTHTPLDGLPRDARVTYVCIGRDPRDVALSFAHHRSNQNPAVIAAARAASLGRTDPDPIVRGAELDDVRTAFWQWVDDDTDPHESASTLRLTLHHLKTVWTAREESNIVLLHYDDLIEDRSAVMHELARRLAITIPDERWPALVAAAGLDRMRAAADRIAPDAGQGFWHDPARFFHRGGSGQWRDLLDDADLSRYQVRVAELAPPDLAAWVHRN